MNNKSGKKIRKLLLVFVALCVFGLLFILLINFYVKFCTKSRIIDIEDLNDKKYDAILVLGAGLSGGGPSPILKERLDTCVDVYEKGVSNYIIMSGDHYLVEHDEVNVMKDYAIQEGISSSNVFMDHAGLSTYDSIYRAKEIFGVEKILIVTQEYHLYRALYIASKLGVEADGVSSTKKIYDGQFIRDLREILARDKDFVKCIFKPKSMILGDTITVSGSGNVTNDKEYFSIRKDNQEIYYTNNKDIIDEYTNMISFYEFKKYDIKNYQEYIMEINQEEYHIDIYKKKVYIRKDDKRILLSSEDSESIRKILKFE